MKRWKKNSPSPSKKRDNIKKLEKEVSLAEEKFENDTNEFKEKEEEAKKNLDAAGEKFEFDKAEEHENEMKQYQEKQVALAEEKKITIEELEQKINDEKKQLERGSEGLARIQLKKKEYEKKMRALTVEKKDGWIQEGRSLAEAVKVLNDLMERMYNLKSVKEMLAREQKEREAEAAAKQAEAAAREKEFAAAAEAEAAKKAQVSYFFILSRIFFLKYFFDIFFEFETKFRKKK